MNTTGNGYSRTLVPGAVYATNRLHKHYRHPALLLSRYGADTDSLMTATRSGRSWADSLLQPRPGVAVLHPNPDMDPHIVYGQKHAAELSRIAHDHLLSGATRTPNIQKLLDLVQHHVPDGYGVDLVAPHTLEPWEPYRKVAERRWLNDINRPVHEHFMCADDHDRSRTLCAQQVARGAVLNPMILLREKDWQGLHGTDDAACTTCVARRSRDGGAT